MTHDVPVNPFVEPRVEKKEVLEAAPVKLSEKEAVLEEIGKILREHNGEESNIGIGHPYWDLVKRYRAL